jgi:hypothetical protein
MRPIGVEVSLVWFSLLVITKRPDSLISDYGDRYTTHENVSGHSLME